MTPAPPVYRFAPSPTGFLHLGHALSAGLNARLAAERHGRFLLRIEDIDPTRRKPEHVAGLFEDLRWLGLSWEEPVLFQSSRMAAYAAALETLQARGLVYPCFCSRRMLANRVAGLGPDHPRDPDGTPLYSGPCRTLSGAERAARIAAGEDHAWRLDMATAIAAAGGPLAYPVEDAEGRLTIRQALPARWGDVVIARREMPASYHLAVTLDDAHQGVTHVVRGMDLAAATDIHRLLQGLFGLPVPIYRFHRLLMDADGQKLAKSRNAPALRDWRQAGLTPKQVWARIASAEAEPPQPA